MEKTIKDQAVKCKEAAGIDFFVNFYCFQSITLLFAHPIMRYSTVGLRTIKCYFLRAIHWVIEGLKAFLEGVAISGRLLGPSIKPDGTLKFLKIEIAPPPRALQLWFFGSHYNAGKLFIHRSDWNPCRSKDQTNWLERWICCVDHEWFTGWWCLQRRHSTTKVLWWMCCLVCVFIPNWHVEGWCGSGSLICSIRFFLVPTVGDLFSSWNIHVVLYLVPSDHDKQSRVVQIFGHCKSRNHFAVVRSEILGFDKDGLLRKHLPRMLSLIKNES